MAVKGRKNRCKTRHSISCVCATLHNACLPVRMLLAKQLLQTRRPVSHLLEVRSAKVYNTSKTGATTQMMLSRRIDLTTRGAVERYCFTIFMTRQAATRKQTQSTAAISRKYTQITPTHRRVFSTPSSVQQMAVATTLHTTKAWHARMTRLGTEV